MKENEASSWSIEDSKRLYLCEQWSQGYFSISERGTALARLKGRDLDLDECVRELKGRGLDTPVLLRFADILEDRLGAMGKALGEAIEEMGYRGGYKAVYPVKVNQMRHVVEEVLASGGAVGIGLEVGSKPELILALSELRDPERLLICNGFQDRTYLKLALMATKMGRRCHIVIDRYEELALCLDLAEELSVRPVLGLRFRLSSRGTGRWTESSGDASKFGLTSSELVQAVQTLEAARMLDRLTLLHFHLGSQITDIRAIKAALREAGRTYCELVRMGASMGWADVGGGLGVDYDGTKSRNPSSKNYGLQEYANDVVWAIQDACDHAGVEHPCLVTESGRASVAHHALLVVDVRARHTRRAVGPVSVPSAESPALLKSLYEVYESIPLQGRADVALEALHDLLQLKEELEASFCLGYLTLEDRAEMDKLYWAATGRLMELNRNQEGVSADLATLPRLLADTYYCNFSIFQSLPDHWAVDQLFPVMPLHRLDEEPTHPALLADLTCDSDGRMDRFIDSSGEAGVLYLHDPIGRDPYYLGIFLVGAYQEVLGDLHNLFGDTHAIHVSIDVDGQVDLAKVVEGDTIGEVLGYLQYDGEQMIGNVRKVVERGLREDLLTKDEALAYLRLYKDSLNAQTYLDGPDS